MKKGVDKINTNSNVSAGVETNTLPRKWTWEKLGDACDVITGTTPPKSDPSNYGSDIPFFKPPHLWDGLISETEEMLSKKGGKLSRMVPPNTVLVTCIGNLGRTGFVKKNAAFNQQINAILENDRIIGKYIFYQAQSPIFRKQLESLATGTTVSIVNKGNFETIEIPIPPIETQQTIVSKIEELFSELDKGIESLKLAQQQLKVYRQSVLKWAFEGRLTNENVKEGELPDGWRTAKIMDIGKIETGTTPSKTNQEYYGDDFPLYKPTDLDAGKNVIESSDGLTKAGLKKARYAPDNSILITCIGATIGKTGFIKRGGAFNQQINAIIPFETTNPKFIYYQAIGMEFQNQILENASATTLPIINKSKFQVLTMSICSLDEQSLIVKSIEESLRIADNMEESINQSLKQSEALRQSILKQVFEGKFF